jgi:hypothetical protein
MEFHDFERWGGLVTIHEKGLSPITIPRPYSRFRPHLWHRYEPQDATMYVPLGSYLYVRELDFSITPFA